MLISFNGKDIEIGEGTTVEVLLSDLRIKKELIVIELNRGILDRKRYPETILSPADSVECISFMGGG